ncbi:UDP-N-acetylenolpyruvoylglucosamine reductase [Thioalkalivibrio nitratireducens DSM 14787]|uniref:UDP-N-acetylenolpyruvoylglucosamine reductase n=1 Tax=Thioalkalivibrio nitratireducens (strain DSM 14787 / UNIQEM 213 / ALEN2) TaxID=1255043 RepID=L0DYW7_THIND|nr:UDP-N-acetylmuramate dehydrogenase [Thioalkalivibrio nitratireducens]AGA34243.1 UDP-N-acetylenolpyruvoylglucosamine reductase [Thioalkalivibrio nitratireducens DSM 14787]
MLSHLAHLRVRGRLERDVPLAPLTSWRVGGPADWLFEPEDADDLAHFLASVPETLPRTVLGLGSNVLIRDGGVDGVVIHFAGTLNQRRRLDDERVELGAGLAAAQAARFCAAEGLTGAEFLAGIPGTVGGALAMNAGAWGGEIWPLVEWAEAIDCRGLRHMRTPADYEIAYRSVRGCEGEFFVRAVLRLQPGDTDAARERIQALLRERAERQPLGLPSCGSVFRNPQGAHAAALIEQAGLKGLRRGGAEVSRKHANFITHDGSATAADIEWLIDEVRTRVEARFGVRLDPEVRILGRKEMQV